MICGVRVTNIHCLRALGFALNPIGYVVTLTE